MHIIVATHVQGDIISEYVCTVISLTETAKQKIQSLADQTRPLFRNKEFINARFIMLDDHGYPVVSIYKKQEIEKYFDLETEKLPIFKKELDGWFSKNTGIQPTQVLLNIYNDGLTFQGNAKWETSTHIFPVIFTTAFFYLK